MGILISITFKVKSIASTFLATFEEIGLLFIEPSGHTGGSSSVVVEQKKGSGREKEREGERETFKTTCRALCAAGLLLAGSRNAAAGSTRLLQHHPRHRDRPQCTTELRSL